jgi:hypothetical protein
MQYNDGECRGPKCKQPVIRLTPELAFRMLKARNIKAVSISDEMHHPYEMYSIADEDMCTFVSLEYTVHDEMIYAKI